MSSSSDQVQGPPGSAQLNGWKEIAAYVGRSVRTVQRWEKDFGLPVRRFGLSRPESVFALSREIDEWLLTSQGASARAGAGAPETAGGPAESSSPDRNTGGERHRVFGRTSVGRMGVAALVTAAVMAVLWMAWFYRHQRGEAMRDGARGGGGAGGLAHRSRHARRVGSPAAHAVDAQVSPRPRRRLRTTALRPHRAPRSGASRTWTAMAAGKCGSSPRQTAARRRRRYTCSRTTAACAGCTSRP